MPSAKISQRHLSSSSFLEEFGFSDKKELGFRKPTTMYYREDGDNQMPCTKSVISSPFEELFPAGALSVDCWETSTCHGAMKHNGKLYNAGVDGFPYFLRASGGNVNDNGKAVQNLYMHARAPRVGTNKTSANGTQRENFHSSSVLSEVFGRKLGLSANNVLVDKFADAVDSCHEEDETLSSMGDTEAQTIRNLLPNEDDLFSGMIDELESIADVNAGFDGDDFDLFSSVGGLELEAGCGGQKYADFYGELPYGPSLPSEHSYGEHCTRTLSEKNFNSNIEGSELGALFEQYGNISSPYRVASAGDHYGLHKPNHTLNHVKVGPSFHHHSLPDFQDNFDISVSDGSSSTTMNVAGKVDLRASDRTNDRQISMLASNWRPMELKEGISGHPGNVTGPVHGHLHSNSSALEHHPSSPHVWPNFPLLPSGFNAPCLTQLPGPTGLPLDLRNTISLPHHLHVGSAPSVSPSPWDGHHIYSGDSLEGSAFCSVGSLGFPARSLWHLSGRAPHIFSPAGGNRMEKPRNDMLHSPSQISHIFPSRNTSSSSFDSREHGRNFGHQKSQGSSSQVDKKQFELDIDRILQGEDSRTTLMLKNIPNKYTSKMLLAALDEQCRGTYDFVYLPIDFKNKCNVGYAFVNLVDSLQVIPFYKAFSGKKWEKFNSEKVAALAYARIQGKAALVAHFQNSSLMNEDKRCRPILFCTDGPNAGEQQPFPMGANVRSRAAKIRTNFSEEKEESVSKEDSVNRSDSFGSASESD